MRRRILSAACAATLSLVLPAAVQAADPAAQKTKPAPDYVPPDREPKPPFVIFPGKP